MTWAAIIGRITLLCIIGAALAYIINTLAERVG